jgi:hypothetical protein
MKGNREAYFSGVFYLIGVGNLAKKSAGYGILENLSSPRLSPHRSSKLK